MKPKIVKDYIYDGLGFPVKIDRVEMIKIHGEWHPKIDVKKIADQAIEKLTSQTQRLTGNQVKFIRSYFSMPLRGFAKEVVHESHTAVSKWESFGDDITNMDANIEMVLRLYVIEKISTKTVKQKNAFYQKYLELKKIFSAEKTPTICSLKNC